MPYNNGYGVCALIQMVMKTKEKQLAAAGDVEIVDINYIPEDFELLYRKEAEYQMEMIKQYDDWRYSHLSKKEREADIKPIRNSKDKPKIGRNELCPCGSGKKYKRCCFSSCC